jgi:hypothetical protein
MTFEFIFIPDRYVVFVLLALFFLALFFLTLFFLIVFFVFYLPITFSSSLAYLFTHLRRPFALRRHPRQSCHPPRR